jgi:hypothetical protein
LHTQRGHVVFSNEFIVLAIKLNELDVKDSLGKQLKARRQAPVYFWG